MKERIFDDLVKLNLEYRYNVDFRIFFRMTHTDLETLEKIKYPDNKKSFDF